MHGKYLYHTGKILYYYISSIVFFCFMYEQLSYYFLKIAFKLSYKVAQKIRQTSYDKFQLKSELKEQNTSSESQRHVPSGQVMNHGTKERKEVKVKLSVLL